MNDYGPIQLLAVAFGPSADYKGAVLDELDRLETKGLVRVLDLLFVGQDSTTEELVAFDYQGDDLGGLIGALLGFEFVGAEVDATIVESRDQTIGFSRADLDRVVRAGKPDEAIALLLIEHAWARDFKNAIRTAGGMPVAEGFLSHELIQDIGQEVEEAIRLIQELEEEDRTGEPPAALFSTSRN
jgi:hypothetical protein